jgi:hypothetical protein
LTLALDAVLHPALFTTAFFAGAFFAAFLTAILLSSFLIYIREPLMGHIQTRLIEPRHMTYRNHAILANQENSEQCRAGKAFSKAFCSRTSGTHQSPCEVGVSSRDLVVLNTCGQRLLASHDDEQFLGPGDGRVNEISLEKKIVLGQERENDRRIFAALALVHGYGVSMDDLVEI